MLCVVWDGIAIRLKIAGSAFCCRVSPSQPVKFIWKFIKIYLVALNSSKISCLPFTTMYVTKVHYVFFLCLCCSRRKFLTNFPWSSIPNWFWNVFIIISTLKATEARKSHLYHASSLFNIFFHIFLTFPKVQLVKNIAKIRQTWNNSYTFVYILLIIFRFFMASFPQYVPQQKK